MPMDFTLNEDQTMLRDSAARVLERSYTFETRRNVVEAEGFDGENWSTFAAQGWLGLAMPEEMGGLGGSPIEVAILMEEVGRAMVVEPLVPAAVVAPRLLHAADPGVAAEYGESMLSGERIVVPALSEPDAGGNVAWVATRAHRTGDAWRIDGHKSLVIGGGVASVLIVSARISGEPGNERGIGLFLVDPAAAGVSAQAVRLSDGSACCDIRFTGAPARLIGTEGEGFAALREANAWGLLAYSAEALGAMDKALWITRDYLQTRKQFGVVIGSFQALQHRASDMLIDVELTRAMIHRALAFFSADSDARDHALSLTKMQVGKAGRFVGGQAIQLHGGIGVTDEYVIGHYYKRLTMIDAMLGNFAWHAGRVAARDANVIG